MSTEKKKEVRTPRSRSNPAPSVGSPPTTTTTPRGNKPITPRSSGYTPRGTSSSSYGDQSNNSTCTCKCHEEVIKLRAEVRKLNQTRIILTNKITLLEERVKSDAKENLTNGTSTKSAEDHDKEIDALHSKIYKLEERNQTMTEEMNNLKSDLRNRKKDHDVKMKEMQLKYEFEIRTLKKQQLDYENISFNQCLLFFFSLIIFKD